MERMLKMLFGLELDGWEAEVCGGAIGQKLKQLNIGSVARGPGEASGPPDVTNIWRSPTVV